MSHVLAITGFVCGIFGMETFTVLYQPVNPKSESKFHLTKRHILFLASQLFLISGVILAGALGIFKFSIADSLNELSFRYPVKPGIKLVNDKVDPVSLKSAFWLALACSITYIMSGLSFFIASVKIYDESDNLRKVLLKKRATEKKNRKFEPDEWQLNTNWDQEWVEN